MLRILQISPTYYPAVRYGGPIRSVHSLASGLARRGHDVHVFTTNVDGDGTLDVPLGQPVAMDDVKVTYFDVPALRRLYWSPDMGSALRKAVPEFDVVHLQSLYLWPTSTAARVAERAKVPYMISPRGMLVNELVQRKSRWVKQAWLQLVERRSFARAQGVHVTTTLEAEEAAHFGFRMPEMFCVPNGVQYPAMHAPLSEGPFADIPKPYALFVGRINWKKGLDRLVRAWKHVPNLVLLIAGNDEERYRPKLQALAAAEGVATRLRFLGPVRDEHKWALYESASMFVLPSYSENFGNVVAEAMAMSCPVVVTPEVGLASLVREVGAGVVSDGDPITLGKAIRELQEKPLLRQQMGQQGRKAVTERLSPDAVAARMEAVYHHITRHSLAGLAHSPDPCD